MENKLMNFSDSEQTHHPSPTDQDNIEENKRYTLIERQITPLLTAISMIELPTSEEDEDEDSGTDNNWTKRAAICSETDNNRTRERPSAQKPTITRRREPPSAQKPTEQPTKPKTTRAGKN